MRSRPNAVARLFALTLLALAVGPPPQAGAILWRSSFVPRGEGGSTGNTSSLRSGDVVDVIVVICGVVLALVVLFVVVRHLVFQMSGGGGRRKRSSRGGRIRGRNVDLGDPDRRRRDF